MIAVEFFLAFSEAWFKQVTLTRCVHMANLRKHLVWHMTLPWPQGRNHWICLACENSTSSRLRLDCQANKCAGIIRWHWSRHILTTSRTVYVTHRPINPWMKGKLRVQILHSRFYSSKNLIKSFLQIIKS